MCGRYTLRSKPERIADEFALAEPPPLTPHYNIAPTQDVPVLRLRQGTPQLVMQRWGLIPSWAKEGDKLPLLINAKSETAAEKPAFRNAFRKRRCLVLADGYFEWQTRGGQKIPYYHRLRSDQPFAFAGLWERWHGPDRPIDSCTILTTDANEAARGIHDRMPVLLDREARRLWLDPDIEDAAVLQELLRPCPGNEMEIYPVNPAVNKTSNDGPECIEPIERLPPRDLFDRAQ